MSNDPSIERLKSYKIGDVSVVLMRHDADNPLQKRYSIILGDADKAHLAFVRGAITEGMDEKGFDIRHAYKAETRTIEFRPQGPSATVRADVKTKEPLGSLAIDNHLKELAHAYPTTQELSSAARIKIATETMDTEKRIMGGKKQAANQLISPEGIMLAIRNAIEDNVSTGGHITNPNIDSDEWKATLRQAADNISAQLQENVSVGRRIR